MHACVCVYVCVYNGYERLHSQREREAGREEAILQQSTISDCGQTTNGWKVLERREKPASLAFQLPKCPPSNTNTLIHTHINGTITLYPQSISAMKTHPSSVMLMGGFWGLEGVEDRGKTEGM